MKRKYSWQCFSVAACLQQWRRLLPTLLPSFLPIGRLSPCRKGCFIKGSIQFFVWSSSGSVYFEISPKRYRFDVLVHNPKEETSIAARHAGAVAAINGSYFDMKAGNSVCYLRKDGVVIDTTSTGVLATVSNGAVLIKKGRLELIPWSKQEEKACTLKKALCWLPAL